MWIPVGNSGESLESLRRRESLLATCSGRKFRPVPGITACFRPRLLLLQSSSAPPQSRSFNPESSSHLKSHLLLTPSPCSKSSPPSAQVPLLAFSSLVPPPSLSIHHHHRISAPSPPFKTTPFFSPVTTTAAVFSLLHNRDAIVSSVQTRSAAVHFCLASPEAGGKASSPPFLFIQAPPPSSPEASREASSPFSASPESCISPESQLGIVTRLQR